MINRSNSGSEHQRNVDLRRKLGGLSGGKVYSAILLWLVFVVVGLGLIPLNIFFLSRLNEGFLVGELGGAMFVAYGFGVVGQLVGVYGVALFVERMRMLKAPKWRLQIHLSTAMIVMFVASILLYLNFYQNREVSAPIYGWPFQVYPTENGGGILDPYAWSYWSVTANYVIMMFVLTGVALGVGLRIRDS